MMKRFYKKENLGITLIALVITIVILIILAAVIINLSLGNNGIFNRAKSAKEQYQNATQYEETEIAKASNEIDSYVDGNRGTVTLTEVQYNNLMDRLELAEKRLISNISSTGINIKKVLQEQSMGAEMEVGFLFLKVMS